jgi:predicted NBD/HSP70 family sugar kinase
MGGRSGEAVRRSSRKRVLEALGRRSPLTSSQLAERTGLSRVTVASVINELRVEGLVEDGGPLGGGNGEGGPSLGRPPESFILGEAAGYPTGIAMGHYGIRVAVGSPAGRLLDSRVLAVDSVDRLFKLALTDAVEILSALLKDHGIEPERVRGVGLGVPAPLDSSTGTVLASTFLPGWSHSKPIAPYVEELISKTLKADVRVAVDNDANICALGELRKPENDRLEDFLFIKASAGIGVSIVSGRQLLRGRGAAGEIGHGPASGSLFAHEDSSHSRLGSEEPRRCDRCGHRGCLEMYASGQAVVDRVNAESGSLRMLSLTDVIARAHDGADPVCLAAIQEAGRYLGRAVARLIYTLDPQAVLIGGILASAGDDLIKPLRHEALRDALRPDVHIRTISEPNLVGVQGAIGLVQETFEPRH